MMHAVAVHIQCPHSGPWSGLRACKDRVEVKALPFLSQWRALPALFQAPASFLGPSCLLSQTLSSPAQLSY